MHATRNEGKCNNDPRPVHRSCSCVVNVRRQLVYKRSRRGAWCKQPPLYMGITCLLGRMQNNGCALCSGLLHHPPGRRRGLCPLMDSRKRAVSAMLGWCSAAAVWHMEGRGAAHRVVNYANIDCKETVDSTLHCILLCNMCHLPGTVVHGVGTRDQNA